MIQMMQHSVYPKNHKNQGPSQRRKTSSKPNMAQHGPTLLDLDEVLHAHGGVHHQVGAVRLRAVAPDLGLGHLMPNTPRPPQPAGREPTTAFWVANTETTAFFGYTHGFWWHGWIQSRQVGTKRGPEGIASVLLWRPQSKTRQKKQATRSNSSHTICLRVLKEKHKNTPGQPGLLKKDEILHQSGGS